MKTRRNVEEAFVDSHVSAMGKEEAKRLKNKG